ncbi:hypothetical protein GCM10011504_46280 [Siccirubricoccus deserti]|uniref:Uncharacterized protein n=1 Tax=Siccirubricoccus deserti TaxID=2013562 RepID=A0A9X0R273_9PROT|nr:hypothetical protein [Siccirubricoccus deserti]MBC4018060.1 hypothetical protein [Siccirubricoccus deserti]GGC62841.1 hypothetical protein GCM10011504_46280 [Siccirubricoccus deserti]
MVRNIILASVLVLGAAGAARAESSARLIGGGEDVAIAYAGTPQNVVGGGVAQVTGGGLDRSYSYGTVSALRAPAAALVGGGENAEVVYRAAPATPVMAERVTLQPHG